MDFGSNGQTHTVDAVNMGGGDFVFSAKRSTHAVDTVDTVDAVDAVE